MCERNSRDQGAMKERQEVFQELELRKQESVLLSLVRDRNIASPHTAQDMLTGSKRILCVHGVMQISSALSCELQITF